MDSFCICTACTGVFQTFEVFVLESDLLKIFTYVSSLQIEENCELPNKLCSDCKRLTEDFYKFKVMCAESDHKLKNAILAGPKIEEISNEVEVKMENEIILNTIEEKVSESENNVEEKIEFPIERLQDTATYSEAEDEVSQESGHHLYDEESNDVNLHKKVTKFGNRRKTKAAADKKSKVEFWQCEPCNKKFFARRKYEGHIREHEGLKPAVCEECGKEFGKFKNLDHHISKWHRNPDRMYQCTIKGCDRTFKSRAGRNLHLDAQHNENGRQLFVCETCGKALSTKQSLVEHQYRHTGEKPFPCGQCGKSFDNSYKLKIHIMRHNNVRNFICPLCGMAKTTQRELNHHLGVHSRAYEEECQHCKKMFGNHANLMQHISIVHHGVKKYVCPQCDRPFAKKQYLTHHIMTHTGEKPHACEICGKRFIQLVALQKHRQTHEKNNKR